MKFTQKFEFSAGRLALDLANTVEERVGYLKGAPYPAEKELLNSYSDLLQWCFAARLVSKASCSELIRVAERSPRRSETALDTIIQFRECFFRLALAAATGREPSKDDVEKFNQFLAKMPVRRLVPANPRSQSHFLISRSEESDPLLIFLPQLVDDAADILSSFPRDRLRVCAMPDCGWLFIDTSKNGLRRWCDMSDCGNRAKAKRFYERTQAGYNRQA